MMAEQLLNQLPASQRLIHRLKACQNDDMAPRGIQLSNSNRKKIQAFVDDLQTHIDQLTDQRRKTLSLIDRVSDPEAHIVLFWRYGVEENKLMPWMDIAEKMHYEPATLYKYHRRGLDYIDQLLESRKDGETHAETRKPPY